MLRMLLLYDCKIVDQVDPDSTYPTFCYLKPTRIVLFGIFFKDLWAFMRKGEIRDGRRVRFCYRSMGRDQILKGDFFRFPPDTRNWKQISLSIWGFSELIDEFELMDPSKAFT